MQIGSQRVSSIAIQKAREEIKSGVIGQLAMVVANFDRQSALGAWEYTMPTDASPATVDWKRYIAGMKDEPYDAKKFFWWRNYKAFGTGVAGDLFVHLISGINVIMDSKGPEKIYASGQTCYWKDGRDVPDVMGCSPSTATGLLFVALKCQKLRESEDGMHSKAIRNKCRRNC